MQNPRRVDNLLAKFACQGGWKLVSGNIFIHLFGNTRGNTDSCYLQHGAAGMVAEIPSGTLDYVVSSDSSVSSTLFSVIRYW